MIGLAVLYTTHGKHFVKYHGQVRADRFYFTDPISGTERHVFVSSKPGVLHDNWIWFETDRDEDARRQLIEYEETYISCLTRKIAAHRDTLKNLSEARQAEDYAALLREMTDAERDRSDE